jgi:hypothetical protein
MIKMNTQKILLELVVTNNLLKRLTYPDRKLAGQDINSLLKSLTNQFSWCTKKRLIITDGSFRKDIYEAYNPIIFSKTDGTQVEISDIKNLDCLIVSSQAFANTSLASILSTSEAEKADYIKVNSTSLEFMPIICNNRSYLIIRDQYGKLDVLSNSYCIKSLKIDSD